MLHLTDHIVLPLVEPEGAGLDDITLIQNILDELEFEPSVDAANIGVTADNGIFTLTGHVSTYAEKSCRRVAKRT